MIGISADCILAGCVPVAGQADRVARGQAGDRPGDAAPAGDLRLGQHPAQAGVQPRLVPAGRVLPRPVAQVQPALLSQSGNLQFYSPLVSIYR